MLTRCGVASCCYLLGETDFSIKKWNLRSVKPKHFNTRSPSGFIWVKKGSGMGRITVPIRQAERKPFSEKLMEEVVTFLWQMLKGRKSSSENCDKDVELKWNFKQGH